MTRIHSTIYLNNSIRGFTTNGKPWIETPNKYEFAIAIKWFKEWLAEETT